MNISVINHTNGEITDADVQRVIRAINRQIEEDFQPYWGLTARLRLEGRSTNRPDTMTLPDLRGDAVIYLWNDSDVDEALGYHEKNAFGIPFGFVFTRIAQEIGEDWSTTFSHEALELIADPETNLLVMGPHPSEDRDVFHWFEMCDAVQAETYDIDGVKVSNFVLPLYFTGTRAIDEVGARNDFLGIEHRGKTLQSFGINPGGYVGFYDPALNNHDTFSIRGDAVAMMRMQMKSQAKQTRRSVRYRTFKQRDEIRAADRGGSVAEEARKRPGKKLAMTVPARADSRDYCSMQDSARSAALKSVASPPAKSKSRPKSATTKKRKKPS